MSTARVLVGSTFLFAGRADAQTLLLEGGVRDASFGWSVASAGDVNGDGYDDVVVGAPTDTGVDPGGRWNGSVRVFLGAADGLDRVPAWTAHERGTDVGRDRPYTFGFSAASAGDVDGDGYDDVVVGSPKAAGALGPAGAAYLYRGSANGLESAISWRAEPDAGAAFFGICVASAGDVNGDGFGDVVVGADHYDQSGAAFLYLGSPAGPSTVPDQVVLGFGSSAFGKSVASAGDVNGDGFGDVVVGAWTESYHADGTAYLYLGSPAGLGAFPVWSTRSFTDAWIGIHGADDQDAIWTVGFSVSTAGDVNGDGYDDVAVGAPGGGNTRGFALVFHGSEAGLETAPAWIGAGPILTGFGTSVASAGDVDGNGLDDVLVGAPGGASARGEAHLYLGTTNGLRPAATNPVDTWKHGLVDARLRPQGDAYLGYSVASAGDVDADGFADVLVGAWSLDLGQIDEGAAFLIHGH